MIKVLFVSSGNTTRGISPIIKNQGASLKKAGLNIEYYTIKGRGISGYLKNIRPLRCYLKTHDFDIIHAHYSLSAFVASLAGAKPLIVSLMGSDVKAKKWYKILLWLFYKYLWDVTIVKSEDMKSTLGFPNIKILPNGVDISLFVPMDKKTCQKELSWSREKVHILFPANPTRPEKNFNLLKSSIRKTRYDNIEVHALVNVAHKAIPTYLNAADVMVLPSLWEGSPNVIKEAMACNTPIVATNVGDVSWLLGEEKGCFISGFEESEFIEKLNRGIEYSKSHNKTEARSRLEKLGLSSSEVAERLINIYKKVNANSRK